MGWTMWVVWRDEDGDGGMKMGMAGQRWGQPDKDGDGRTKMGTARQRWGQLDKDGDSWTKMGTNPDRFKCWPGRCLAGSRTGGWKVT